MDNGASSYRRFLAGDETGLTELVRQFANGLMRFVLPIVGDVSAAEDIAQETFARLCLKKPAYKDTASFKTWLYTIARRLALDSLKKSARTLPVAAETLDALPDPADTPEESVLRREEQAAVRRAMGTLKADYAQVLTLTYVEGLSNRQTARIMRRSVHAVENLNSRARAALREALKKEGSFDENL